MGRIFRKGKKKRIVENDLNEKYFGIIYSDKTLDWECGGSSTEKFIVMI